MANHRLVTRIEWGAKPPNRTADLPVASVVRTSIHHGGNPKLNHMGGADQMRKLQDDYLTAPPTALAPQGFADIPYNFCIDEQANVFEGRGIVHEGGASVGHWNAECVSVCFLGDYTQPDMVISELQLDAARWLRSTIILPAYPRATFVDGHKDEYNTACPSPQIYARLAEIEVAWQADGPIAPAQPIPPVPPTSIDEANMLNVFIPLPHVGMGLYRVDHDFGLGRDPQIIGLVQHGPFPTDPATGQEIDGWWLNQSLESLRAQVHEGKVIVTGRARPDNLAPADTHVFLTVA